jgi:cyclopropane fatty-acyl-phospholipid synthase-like methyltransferase
MDHYKETIQTWNKLANLYEERFMDLTIYNESYDFVCNALSKDQTTVLEVGCGPGMISRYLLSKRPDLHFLGTDVSPNMIATARKNVPGAQFEVLDSRKIRSLNQNFDAIVSGFCIPYLSSEDVKQFISDAGKIINQNGVFYLSFIAGKEEQSGYQTGSSGDRVYFYYHPEERILEQLKNSGFELVKRFVIPFERANGDKEEHLVLIARKLN